MAVLMTLAACRDAASPDEASRLKKFVSVAHDEMPYCDLVDEPQEGTNCQPRPSGGDTWDEYYDSFTPADSTLHLDLSDVTYASNVTPAPICLPIFSASMVPGVVFPSRGGSVHFVASGTWTLLSIFDVASRIGTYDFPDGWWPSTAGDGVQVSIDSGDAICDLTFTQFRATFVSFHGVRTRKQRPPGGGSSVPASVGWDGTGSGPSQGGSNQAQTDVQFECFEWREPNGTYHPFCQRA